MRPKTITATGIKTGGIRVELAPLTLVTGDNGKGKTAIADAARIVLLGYHPTLGSRSPEIMKLANGNVLEVDINDGITRTFTRKGRSVACERSPAATKLDETRNFSPVILDFESFLQAKPTARREILEACLPALNPTEILQEINAKLVSEAVEGEFEETPDFVTLTKAAGEKGKEWKQEVSRLKGSVSTIEIEIAEDPDPIVPPEASPESFTARRDDVLGRKGRAEEALKSIKDRVRNAPTHQAGKRVTEDDVARLKASLASEKEKADSNREAESRNREIKRTLTDLQVDQDRTYLIAPEGTPLGTPTTPRNPNFEAFTKTAAEKGESLKKTIASEEAAIKGHLARACEISDQVEALSASGCCPTCGVAGAMLKATVEEHLQPKLDLFTTRANECEGRLTALNDDLQLIAIGKFETETVEAEWTAFDAVTRRVGIIDQATTLARGLVEVEGDEYDEVLNRLCAAEVSLKSWNQFDAACDTGEEDIPELEEALGAAEQNLADVDHRILEARDRKDAAAKRAARSGMLVTAKEGLSLAKGKVVTFKALGDWSKTRSLEVTAERLKPLLNPANSILAGVVEGKLAIEGTDAGLVTPEGDFRSIEVLSGAESTAVAAAIQVAIAASSTLSFVIIDELSRLTWERKKKIVENVHDAITVGLIEGALVIDHDSAFVNSFEGRDDVSVHSVE